MGKNKFGRKDKQQPQYPRFLVVLEGAVTEVQYFEAIRRSRLARSAQIVYLPPGPTSPGEIVRRAIVERDQNRRIDPFEHVWCVFDAEAKLTQVAREGLIEALYIAMQNNISIALSNPCFELWLLLHEEERQAWIDSKTLQHRCSTLRLINEKHLCNPVTLIDRYAIARDRAQALESKHDREGKDRLIDRNPCSRVFLLVDSILAVFPAR